MPNEILREIIGALVKALPPALRPSAYATWKQNLSSLSRTNTAFTAICQQLLFETIVIGPRDFQVVDESCEKEYLYDANARSRVLFGDIFPGATAQLASYVRILTYRDYAGHPYGLCDDERSTKALRLLTNVSELRIAAKVSPSKTRPYHDVLFEYDGDLEQALLKIMHGSNDRFHALRLTHVRVPAAELLGCGSSLKTLELTESPRNSDSDFYVLTSSFGTQSSLSDSCDSENPRNTTPVAVERSAIRLEHFTYRGGYRTNGSALLPETFITNRLLFRWDQLRTASLGFDDSNSKIKSEIPNHILRHAERLERLELYTTRPSDPFGPRDQQCPIGSLHCGAFETLTHISLRVDYAVDNPRRIGTLRDPYHGLLSDGMLQKLENLEELSLKIRFGGHLVRAVYEDEAFLGGGWTQLDRTLAPKGRARPFKRMREASVLFGVMPDSIEEDYDADAFERAFLNVVSKFEGMGQVEWRGVGDW